MEEHASSERHGGAPKRGKDEVAQLRIIPRVAGGCCQALRSKTTRASNHVHDGAIGNRARPFYYRCQGECCVACAACNRRPVTRDRRFSSTAYRVLGCSPNLVSNRSM